MTIDLSQLNAADLEALIAEAAQRRAQMAEPWPGERPQGAVQAIPNPPWYVSPTADGTLLQIACPGLGWLPFLIRPADRALLLSLLLQQAILHPNPPAQSAAATTATAPVGGGGSVH